MSVAAGSASEVEYKLLHACGLNYLKGETDPLNGEFIQQGNGPKKTLNNFSKKLTANG